MLRLYQSDLRQDILICKDIYKITVTEIKEVFYIGICVCVRLQRCGMRDKWRAPVNTAVNLQVLYKYRECHG